MPQHNSRSFKDQVFPSYREDEDKEVYRSNLQHTGMRWNARYEYLCTECGMTWNGYGELRPACPSCDLDR